MPFGENFLVLVLRMGKLNVSLLRYMQKEEFRVLTAVCLLSVFLIILLFQYLPAFSFSFFIVVLLYLYYNN